MLLTLEARCDMPAGTQFHLKRLNQCTTAKINAVALKKPWTIIPG